MRTTVAFDTVQEIEFLKWRATTELDSTHYELVDIQAGWDPDYATGVYYCWHIWQLSEHAVQEYFHSLRVGRNNMHTYTTQLELDLDYTLCNWPERIRFP